MATSPIPLTLVAFAILITGCVDTQPASEPGNLKDTYHQSSSNATLRFEPPVIVASQVPQYGVADEPTVAAATDGTIYVSAKFALIHDYFSGNPGNARVWRSDDGKTFTLLNDAAGRLTNQRQGNQDTDLYVDDIGRVHLADLHIAQTGLDASTVPYIVSDDRGETWVQAQDFHIEGKGTDRQWIAGDGDLVVIVWRALPGAIGMAISNDGGYNWNVTSQNIEHRKLGNVAVHNQSIVFGVLRGNADLVMVESHDAGATWREELVSGTPSGAEGILFPTVAIGPSGTIYASFTFGMRTNDQWSESNLFFAHTLENGTWAALTQRTSMRYALMPSITVLPNHMVALSYLATRDEGSLGQAPHEWHVFVELGIPANTGLNWSTSQASVVPAHEGGICVDGGNCALFGRVASDRRMGEVFEIGHTQGGDVLVTWPSTSTGDDALTSIMFARGLVEGV